VINKYDSEKDEVIKPRKRQVVKDKTKKSKHKHEWVATYHEWTNFFGVKTSVQRTTCSICNKEK
jgi:hypothetical protein